ncbi:MAG: T9SS type A sorting domain-containing protein [Chitinophagales bacterium]
MFYTGLGLQKIDILGETLVCTNNEVTFNIEDQGCDGFVTYEWSVEAVTGNETDYEITSDNITSNNINVIFNNVGTYIISLDRNTSCTTARDEVSITVIEADINFEWQDKPTYICQNENAFFSFSASNFIDAQVIEAGTGTPVADANGLSFTIDMIFLDDLNNCFELHLTDENNCIHIEEFCIDAACIDITPALSPVCIGEEVTLQYIICNPNAANLENINFSNLQLPNGVNIVELPTVGFIESLSEGECITIPETPAILEITDQFAVDVEHYINLEVGYTLNGASTSTVIGTSFTATTTPSIAVNKTVEPASVPIGGSTVVYSIELTNETENIIDDIQIADVLPEGLNPIESAINSPELNYDGESKTISFLTPISLGGNISQTFQYEAMIAEDVSCSELENCVSVVLEDGACETSDCAAVTIGSGNNAIPYAVFCGDGTNIPIVNPTEECDIEITNDFILPENITATWMPTFNVDININPFFDGSNYSGHSANPVYINGTIRITAGCNITINDMHIEFGPNGRIVIEPTADLTLSSCSFTGNTACKTMWQGIRLIGPILDNADNNSITINNGTEINSALIGLATLDLPIYDIYNIGAVLEPYSPLLSWGESFTPLIFPDITNNINLIDYTSPDEIGGGTVSVNNANFLNCFHGINLSFARRAASIKETLFTCEANNNEFPYPLSLQYDEDLQNPQVIGEAGIEAIGAQAAINVSNACIFRNMRFGIRTYLPKSGVVSIYNSFFQSCIVGTSFNNLNNSNLVMDSEYCCCQIGIQAQNYASHRIFQNSFKGDCPSLTGYDCIFDDEIFDHIGILMRNTKFDLSGNIWGNFNGVPAPEHGIVIINNVKSNGGTISDNTLEGNQYGLYALENNENVFTCQNQFLFYENDAIHVGISEAENEPSYNYTPSLPHQLAKQGNCEGPPNLQYAAGNTFFSNVSGHLDIYLEPNAAVGFEQFEYHDIEATSRSHNPNYDGLSNLVDCANTQNSCLQFFSIEQIPMIVDDTEKDRQIMLWMQHFASQNDWNTARIDSANNLLDAVNSTLSLAYAIELNLQVNNLSKAAEKLALYPQNTIEEQYYHYIVNMQYNLQVENKSIFDINGKQVADLLAIAQTTYPSAYTAQAILGLVKGYEFPINIAFPNPDIIVATCGVPTNLNKTNLSCNSVTLNWDAMPDAEAYILAGRKLDGAVKVFPETQNTFRTFTSGLQTNTTYQWSVKTKCDGVWTVYADIADFTTPSCKNSDYNIANDPFVSETENYFVDINLYPNPAKDELHITFTSFETENIQLSITDILGKTVLQQDFESKQGENNILLQLDKLQTGYYFLTIDNGTQQSIEKFMVW